MSEDVKFILQTLEGMSKRVRFLETLPRPTSSVVDTFLELADTPSVYAGYGGFAVFVNPTEDGLRFDPVGGACVAFVCGPVGWRGTGGTVPRTLVHEVAFQLDTGGNARGSYAVDLQQDRANAAQVAAGDYSAVLGGERNEIHPNSEYSTILGSYNDISDFGGNEPWDCHAYGFSNEILGDCSGIHCIGSSHEITNSSDSFFSGYNQESLETYGSFSFIEGNDLIENASGQAPTYVGSFGLYNDFVGDVWESWQFGESNFMEGDGGGGADQVWMCLQIGYNNKISEQGSNVWQFGRSLDSYLPVGLAGDFFTGRMILCGDNPQESPSGVEFSGFNQNSWFNQDTAINTWTVAWISSRFQFPIIEDSIWFFEAYIAGTELGCANSYAWKIEGVVENDGGTTTILVSTVTNVYRDVVTKEWQVVADDPNDRLVFQFRDTAGPDATRCNIQFSMHTVEVGYD